MQFDFFDIDNKHEKLTELGDPLVQIDELIDFTIFQAIFFKGFPTGAKWNNSRPN